MDIIEINRRTVFTLEEAQELLPLVLKITKSHSSKVSQLIDRLESGSAKTELAVVELEAQVNQLIHDWQCKIQKLGALPKGLWLADFDAGDGYFCWKFPESKLEFWHSYNDGYSKRILLSEHRRPLSLQDRLRRKIFPLITTPLVPPPTSQPLLFKAKIKAEMGELSPQKT